jgi:alkanesulfonate monooxygenase SsuD/methylene tetrahydromethanopterin reductase-like flavin-dependent oxidoreductase (luciferase family)
VPSFIGTPEQCREQLLEIAARYATDEIMIQCYADAPGARVEAYEALADVFGLG